MRAACLPRREGANGRPVQCRAPAGQQRQEPVAQQAGDGQRHFELLAGGEYQPDVLQPECGGEARGFELVSGDETAVGLIHGRAEQRRGEQLEVVLLVGKAGVDKQQYLEILTSTLFGAPIYQTYGALIARGEFEPAGFAATLGLKDVRLMLSAGDELQVPLPIASLLRDRFLTLLAGGGGALDWSAVGALAAWEAGGPHPAG